MAVVSDAISTPIVVRSVTAIVDSFVRRVAASLADAARKRQARQTDGNRSSKTSHFHCQAASMCRGSVCRPNKLITEKAGAKATDLIAALPCQYIHGLGEHPRRKVGSFLPKARAEADGRLRCTMRVFPRDASKVVDGVARCAPGRLRSAVRNLAVALFIPIGTRFDAAVAFPKGPPPAAEARRGGPR